MAKTSTLCFAGSGWITQVHGVAAQTLGMPVVAVASRTPANAVKRAEQVRAQACHYDELPLGADIAIVCTNPARHLADTRIALAGGAAVIVEKPLAFTLAEADEMVALAVNHGQRVGYAENMAFAPVVVDMLRRVATIGALTHIESRAINSRPTWGDFMTAEWGGGALFDLGAHPIAIAVLIARAADPSARAVSVRGEVSGAPDIVSDEHGEVWITFSSGVTAHVVASWAGSSPVWDAQASSATGVVQATIMPLPELSVNGDAVPCHVGANELEQFGYVEQLRSLSADITAGVKPVMSAAFGRDVMDITCGAYESARIGEAVSLPFAGDRTKSPLELWRP